MPAENNSADSKSSQTLTLSQRRILALHLPDFLLELVQNFQKNSSLKKAALHQYEKKKAPLAVLLVENQKEVRPNECLAAVCAKCARAGVRVGQTVAEAGALLAGLEIEVIERAQVQARLLAIAELAAKYGSNVSWNVAENIDSIFLDITGVGHLFGGEKELCDELSDQVRALGHRVRIAVAPGPQIAGAVSRFVASSLELISPQMSAQAVGQLPLSALPLDKERIAWLARLGIFQVSQVAELPPSAVSARLGPHALSILELAQGIDRKPLVAGEFPRSLEEKLEWEEASEGISPLLFALHGLVSRLSARLSGRGEACAWLECELIHDPAIARHRGTLAQTILEFELSTPLYRKLDLERVLRARLEGCRLTAPTIGIRLSASQLTSQAHQQITLSKKGAKSFHSGAAHSQEFPVLLAELQSDVGSDGVGTLRLENSLMPEGRSLLAPFRSHEKSFRHRGKKPATSREKSSSWVNPCPQMDRFTRLLPFPERLSVPLQIGEFFALGCELFTIEKLQFLQRLQSAEWWSEKSITRDYHWAWLRSAQGGTEALIYVEPHSGSAFVQALSD